MKLKSIALENFRCFEEKTTVAFDDLTAFIGKNDIGKSTVLEALEIYFNSESVKLELSDFNINHKDKPVVITCDFCDIPNEFVLDSEARTDFESEYLTFEPGILRIQKEFLPKKTITSSVFILAKHPKSSTFAKPLITLKEKELQNLIKEKGLDCSLKGNPRMRKALWDSLETKEFEITKMEVSSSKTNTGDLKNIWEQIAKCLPRFAYFRSDRRSTDSDSEIQDPMKEAAKLAVREMASDISKIQEKIQTKALEIARETQETLKEFNENIAKQLQPRIASPNDSKWASLFPISLDTEDGIPLNKRGSGVRRLVLVAFFRAMAEKKITPDGTGDIIYAIEEPETAQHPNNQKILLKSLLEISESGHTQVVLTTHSPALAGELPCGALRFIRDSDEKREILSGKEILPEIAKTLGVFPMWLNKVKVVVCVEGPADVVALKALGRCLRERNSNFVDLERDLRVLVIPMGGSSLESWVKHHYLANLNCPEVHIYDRDVEKYKDSVNKVNARGDGSWATLTKKFEIENYLNPKAIKEKYGVEIDTSQENVPEAFAEAVQGICQEKRGRKMNSNTAKKKLSRVFEESMTMDYLDEIDPEGEVKSWFEKITELANA